MNKTLFTSSIFILSGIIFILP